MEIKNSDKDSPNYCSLEEIVSLSDPGLYVNRELSLLAFQWRVLEEAEDATNPLLERFKFLSIVGSNLEEFFMVRVAGLKRQVEDGNMITGSDGLNPSDQLIAIREEVINLFNASYNCLSKKLMPALIEEGIQTVLWKDLSSREQVVMRRHFMNHIFPVLTPLAFDPGHPFPHISNLSLNLAILIKDGKGEERFARIKVPDTLPQLIRIGNSASTATQGAKSLRTSSYLWLDDLIKANLTELFPGMSVIEAHPFHVTRDAELEIQEWEAADLLATTEEGVRQRRFGDVVRLLVDNHMPQHLLDTLAENLEIRPIDVYRVEGKLPLSNMKHIAALERSDLKDTPFVPSIPTFLNPDTQEEDIFASISRRDILLNHPYHSFQPVVNFLNTAARDKSVLAIKMTLYRVGKNSPVVEALLEALRRGKQVAVLVELKARFDEESNIEWAKALEREGVHVVYGLVGLKIHSKVALVVRKEGDIIKRYVHMGTGNYNPVTAHLYSDLGIFTCDAKIGSDVTDLFNYVTGYSAKSNYRKLLVAPINLNKKLEELIHREIEHQKNGIGGHLIFKVNALQDDNIIRLLYQASQAGVKVDLLVRGTCCLRPGLSGISDNIKVISIVGRFLEHSRIFYFRNGGKEEIFMGSADLMTRNLSHRVEVVVPVEDPNLAKFLHKDLLLTQLADNVKARYMQPDGTYVRPQVEPDVESINSQLKFLSGKLI